MNAPASPQISSAKVTESSGSNFVSSFWFLPEEKRKALVSIYAFCRLTDDIADLEGPSHPPAAVRQELDNWRKETSKAFQHKSHNPVLMELAQVVDKYKIPTGYFQELIDGVQMDLDVKSYETFDDLHAYCYRVASVVGLICLDVFGYKNMKSKEYAVNLGIAFQLTNILRDIKTDAERGRVYIPEEDLKEAGLKREDILSLAHPSTAARKSKQFRELVMLVYSRAEHYYRKAKSDLVWEDRPNLIAAEVMCAVYYGILRKIRSSPTAVLHQKVKLSRSELMLRVAQGWVVNKLRL